MTEAAPLDSEELLLRRFDPSDSRAILTDEHDGSILGVTGGALVWSKYPKDEVEDCCSMSRESILNEHGHDRWHACDSRNTALAISSRKQIEDFVYSKADGSQIEMPFTAAEDPLIGSDPLDKAHAAVHTRRSVIEMGRGQWDKAKSQLARRAFSVQVSP